MSQGVVKIAPHEYPQVPGAQAVMRALLQSDAVSAAERALKDGEAILRGAVESHLTAMLSAAEHCDHRNLYNATHEVRGLAGNAGLPAAAAIASGLCHYLDAVQRAGLSADHAVVDLHLEALLRAARAEDDATRLGEAVTESLAALVAKKLADINPLESKRSSSAA